MSTIGNLAAGSQAQADALDTVLPAENGAANATVKFTILQLLLSMLRPSQLTAGVTANVTAAAKFLVEDPTFAAPLNRYLTLPQMVALMHARVGQITKFQPRAKVGTTAGWVVAAADNLGKIATLPAGVTAGTLVIPLPALKIGSTITAFTINGSMQSAGNTATLTADLRALTDVAAGATDASIAALAAPVSVTANTVVSVANATKAGIAEVVAAGKAYYLLITATTAAATTEEITSVDITVTEA